jgi:hypothetical protein
MRASDLAILATWELRPAIVALYHVAEKRIFRLRQLFEGGFV